MPITPSSYRTNYPITAHQLNQDLYTYDGSYFGANGVMFHSNRPLMCESYQSGNTVFQASVGGSVTVLGGTVGSAISIIDTSAYYGTGSDGPGEFARFQASGAQAPGSSGIPGQPGGWELMFTFVPLRPSFSGTNSTYGVFWNLSANKGPLVIDPLQDIGCIQPGSTTNGVCGFAVDLIQRNPPDQTYGAGVSAQDPSGFPGTIASNTQTTTGVTPRLCEIWMSVLNGEGFTVPSIPSPIATITTATTFTSATLNTSINQTFNLLNNPPILNCQMQSTVAITPNVATLCPFKTTPFVDSYSGFSTASSTYTVPLTGIYFMHANIIYATNWNVGQAIAGFSVGTTTYWGGAYNGTPGANLNAGASVTKVLDLQAGDTVKVVTKTSTSSNFGTANVSHFIMTWMTGAATTTQSWTAPDVTGFMFAAATPPGSASGQLANIMNSKIANDINFLLNRPYLTVYQSTAQTGLSVSNNHNLWLGSGSTFRVVTMQSTLGLVHGSFGDNYAGWSTANNYYVAPVSGWYLAVAEYNCATISTSNSYNQIVAGFSVHTSGGMTAPSSFYSPNQVGTDWFQELNVGNAWTYPTGATAMNIYYLLQGETIAPVAQYISGTASTWATDVSHGFNSHFNLIWLSN